VRNLIVNYKLLIYIQNVLNLDLKFRMALEQSLNTDNALLQHTIPASPNFNRRQELRKLLEYGMRAPRLRVRRFMIDFGTGVMH
jgi:hypothetical protein